MNGEKAPTFGLRVISVNGIFYDDRAEELWQKSDGCKS